MKHGTAGGYTHGCRCQPCRAAGAIYAAAYYAEHSAEVRARVAAYRQDHAAEIRARKRAYRAAHLEELRAHEAARRAATRLQRSAYQAGYQAAHAEQYETYQRAYHAAHRKEASDRAAAWRIAHPEERRAASHRRRARIAGVESEPFTLRDVIDRDGWRCGICGKKVRPESKGRDRPSLDHVIPISEGGPHTLANAQLAHLGCNARKGARATVPSQLRLLG